ncbi:kelch-like protein 24 [Branchiostoma floridae x Branchiostoma japonicum]
MAGEQRLQTSFDFCHNPHAASLLHGLQELRSESLLVDVVLCASGKEIPCHRPVLSACSGYFHGMFCYGHRESKAHKVDINGVGPDTLQLIVDYAYTSKVTITEGNAVKLLEGASFLQVRPVFDACSKFISEHLSVQTCLDMVYMGRLLSPELYKRALSYVMKEFTAVSKTAKFLDLTKDQLITLISSDDLSASEETVYKAVMTWINHNIGNRQKEMRELMELVRFPLMDKMYFLENVQTNEAVRKSCQDIVTETLKYQLFPGEVQSPRVRPRCASGVREAVVVIGGCTIFSVMACSTAPFHSSWVPMTRMKYYFDQGFAVAVLGTSDIILSAGVTGSREVWMYQLELNLWSQLASMKFHRHDHKLAVVQGRLYAIGGIKDPDAITSGLKSAFAAVEVYDRSKNKWTEGVPLPQPRYKHAVTVVNGNIYVMGGRDAGNQDTSTVYRLSPGDSNWEPQSNMPERAADITAAVVNGAVYVAGIPSKVLQYKPGENGGCWSVVANSDDLLPRCGIAVCGGKVHIYGGCGSNGVLCLNPETMSLEHVGYMQGFQALDGHACVTVLIRADTKIPQVSKFM